MFAHHSVFSLVCTLLSLSLFLIAATVRYKRSRKQGRIVPVESPVSLAEPITQEQERLKILEQYTAIIGAKMPEYLATKAIPSKKFEKMVSALNQTMCKNYAADFQARINSHYGGNGLLLWCFMLQTAPEQHLAEICRPDPAIAKSAPGIAREVLSKIIEGNAEKVQYTIRPKEYELVLCKAEEFDFKEIFRLPAQQNETARRLIYSISRIALDGALCEGQRIFSDDCGTIWSLSGAIMQWLEFAKVHEPYQAVTTKVKQFIY